MNHNDDLKPNNEEEKEKQDDELLDFIKQLEDVTGEEIDMKDIKIKKAPNGNFFKAWIIKTLIETVLIFIALFGFVNLFNVFNNPSYLWLFIYLAIPSVLYLVSSLIIYLFRKRIVFLFNNIILSVLLMIYIIVPAFFMPNLGLNHIYSIFIVSLIVGISKTLILRTIRKFR